MIFINIKCPVCGAIFSLAIDKENCSSKECPKCKNEIQYKEKDG